MLCLAKKSYDEENAPSPSHPQPARQSKTARSVSKHAAGHSCGMSLINQSAFHSKETVANSRFLPCQLHGNQIFLDDTFYIILITA